MSTAFKAAVVVLPFLLVFLGIRACSKGSAGRWKSRIARFDPEARVAVDTDRLIVIAPDVEWGKAAAGEVNGFLDALTGEYGDLLGSRQDRKIVIVLFSTLAHLQERAGRRDVVPGGADRVHGFTDPSAGAIYLPPESGLDTLRHETVHLQMALSNSGEVQHSPWLVEGLAQLFEPFDPSAKPPVPPGVSPVSRAMLARLLPDDAIDVRRLLVMQSYEDFVARDPFRNYLQALVLTAFLFGERDRDDLRRYIEEERVRTAGREEAFARIYRYHEGTFRGDLRAFVRRLKTG